MKATVHSFAALREKKGLDMEEVDVRPGDTVKELYYRLFPGKERDLPVAYARNAAHTSSDTPVQSGDEVAFLPPLGGG